MAWNHMELIHIKLKHQQPLVKPLSHEVSIEFSSTSHITRPLRSPLFPFENSSTKDQLQGYQIL